MKNKKAKFFCENCGAEVPENARVCKKCGKFFISVRCPSCGKTGNSSDFKNGCPSCGYAVANNKQSSGIPTLTAIKEQFFSGLNRPAASRAMHKPLASSDSLPIWIYIVTSLIFFGVISCALFL
ncbi:MAG: zinc ribbon domain-containing protein [Treponema sp.]